MNIVNLNKHKIVVRLVLNGMDESKTFEPSGLVASIGVKQVVEKFVNGVACVKNEYGEVVGLPEPKEDTLYLVNAIVLERARLAGRVDCIAPDTGPTAIRENGQVVAVVRFVM